MKTFRAVIVRLVPFRFRDSVFRFPRKGHTMKSRKRKAGQTSQACAASAANHVTTAGTWSEQNHNSRISSRSVAAGAIC